MQNYLINNMHNYRNTFLLALYINYFIIPFEWEYFRNDLWREEIYPSRPTNFDVSILCFLQAGALELKENLAAAGGAPWPYPAVYPYEAAFAGYPFNG